MSSATIGYGLTFAFSSDGSNFTTINEVFDVTPNAPERSEIDVTHYTSPNRYMEYIPGLVDAGSIEVEANWLNDATQDASTGVTSLIDETDNYTWRITFADTTTWTCEGFLTTFQVSPPNNDKQTLSFTVKLTGEPTVA